MEKESSFLLEAVSPDVFFFFSFYRIILSMKKKSIYCNASVAKPLRKCLSYLIDFFLSFLVSLILFGVIEAFMNMTPKVKRVKEDGNKITQSMFDMVLSSGLGKEKDGTLITKDAYLDGYLKGSVLGSLERHGDAGASSDIYQGIDAVYGTDDGIYRYFVSFKSERLEDYGTNAREEVGIDFYRKALVENADVSYFETEGYPSLTLSTAKAVDEYFRNPDYEIGKGIYEKLDASYRALLEKGIYDIEHNYRPYMELNGKYEECVSSLYTGKNIGIIVSYLLGLSVVYILFPLIFRDGKTLSFRFLSLAKTDRDGNEVKWYQYLIQFSVMVIESPILISFVAIVFYGSSAIDWISRVLFLNFSFLSLSLYSFLLLLASSVMTFAMRETHQTFSELLSFQVVRDLKLFDVKKKEINDGTGNEDGSSDL